MADSRFPIPEEFQSQLRWVEAADARSDEEILDTLTKHVPISSEKNIWTYWHAGVRAMPSWTQRNVINWAKLCGPSWTVRVLDTVPGSPNHALKWITPDLLPQSFVEGTMEGPYVGPHSADFQRGAALWLYGGVWMDVGNILVRTIDGICWKQLEDPELPYQVSVPLMFSPHMANHFVAARKGDPFIKHWHDLFMHLWKGRTSHEGVIDSPLVSFAKEVKFEDAEAKGFSWEWKVGPEVVMNYIGQVLSWSRLIMLEEPNGGFNGREYYRTKVLLFDALHEDWAAEDTIGYDGQDLFNAFACSRDIDPQSKEYQDAHNTIWRILTRASLQKITHGKNLIKGEACGIVLDKPENEGIDIKQGTFFELLRYGQVHFEQTRKEIEYVKAVPPDFVIRKGLLEA